MNLVIKERPETINKPPTICLNMIVKNESKIITRMFDAVLSIIDCYCICDTGSTDNTVDIINQYFITKGITGKVISEPFKNFAHNRNVALNACKGMSDYILLLDADMILYVDDKFNKNSFSQDYYYLFQGNANFYYQNVRIIRNNGLFSYVGVTHEYINVPAHSIGGKVFAKDKMFINDIGDGGSKSDKFKRDIFLLEQGLEKEPGNTRYVFYLGNSYRDYGEDEKAISTYIKLLTMNGWLQEKFCACYSIGNIYSKKSDNINALKYWLKTNEYDCDRIEGIVKAAEYYRNNGDNIMVNLLYHKYKGYKRNLAEGKLFVEQDKYKYCLEYNNSISAYYANDKENGYVCCKMILMNNIMPVEIMKLTLTNMCFYKEFLIKDKHSELVELLKKIDHLIGEPKKDNELWREITNILQLCTCNNKCNALGTCEVVNSTAMDDVASEMNLEAIYQRIRDFRIHNKYSEAMELYQTIPKTHTKYVDYLWKLAYEYAVFSYYIGVRNINDEIVTIFNRCNDANITKSTFENMKFYNDILEPSQTHDYTFSLKHKINGIDYVFNSSSSCIIPYNTGYLLNVRLVNYRIDKAWNYVDCDKHIISLYKAIELASDFSIIKETLIDVNYVDRRYIGIEDVRIFNCKEQILFTGTGYHKENTIGVSCGVYATNNKIIEGMPLQAQDIKPACNQNSVCEKNWTYVNYKGEPHMIYSWFPLKICKVNRDTGLLDMVEERTMPAIFKNARGSSCGAIDSGINSSEVWFVVHIVSYEKPRYYYHIMVVFDQELKLLRYSAPFKFEGECIEYCIGLVVEAKRVIIPYSIMDRTTKVAIYDKKYIENKMKYNLI